MLDPKEIDVLRATPLVMLADSEEAAVTFYNTLFEQCPEVRSLFPDQMSGQARKFAATLIVAINSLSDWDSIVRVIEALARRHIGYGVAPEHYDVVGKALITTLQKYDATPEELALWTTVYGRLSSHMIRTAYPT